MRDYLKLKTVAIVRQDRLETLPERRFILELPKLTASLAGQVDIIMLDEELSRKRNQKYLDRLSYAQCRSISACDLDWDDYDNVQNFFEIQHAVR